LFDELREKHRFTNAKAARPRSWYHFTSGAGRFQYGMSFAASGELRSELYIDFDKHSKNELAFDALYAEKDVIEKEFGEPLRWERLDNRRACRVGCYTVGSIEDPVESHEQYRNWAIDRLLRFKRVFGPRLPALAKRVQEA
ncbi:MAG TPA: DUF4268 domain-containing protein, partial [Haliangium sp.]|nr:DUF4268 domain-containing protein [Haliangium sp.]